MEEKTLSLTQRMGEDLANLLGVSVNMVQRTELASLLKFIMDEAARILDAERCTLYLVDEGTKELRSFIAQRAEVKEIRLPLGKGIAGHVAKTVEVVNLEDAYQSPLFDPKTDKETGYKTRTVLCIPMKDKNNRVIGVLQALNKKKGTFNTHDEWLFKSYATCASNSISAITGGEKAAPDAKSRENLERLSLTVENIPDGVIMLLREEDCVVVNPAARWMLGLEINKIVDKKGVEECLKEIGLGNVLKWLGGEVEKLSSQEITLQGPKERVLKADFAGINGDAGLKKGLVIVLRDITKEKEMDRIKSEFIAIASHEFLSPLTSMKSAVALFLQGMLGPTTDTQKRFLNIMKDSVEYLSYLATTLLDISLIESKKMRLKEEKVDLSEIVRSSIESLRYQAEKKGISLLSKDGNIPPVLADPHRVRQAVLAILDNALKFSPQGGEVVVSIESTGKEIEVGIKDNGIGIPLKEQEKIFEKFYQVESSITREHYGLGLGLSICKDIIEAQGGRIWVESKVGEGSRFAFTLPLRT
ncbi:MAG: ATP-binding protein [Candidatus Brocadiales bacterium]|nr:ATP-binding protein [Candidatus Brocadiales bacterium]